MSMLLNATQARGEIDIYDGFVLVKSFVIVEPGSDTTVTPEPTVRPPPTGPGPGPAGGTPVAPPGSKIRSVQIKMKLGKARIFKTLQPLGNLADKAGEITVTVDATNLSDVDQTWLRNAVEEPLAEADTEAEIAKTYDDTRGTAQA